MFDSEVFWEVLQWFGFAILLYLVVYGIYRVVESSIDTPPIRDTAAGAVMCFGTVIAAVCSVVGPLLWAESLQAVILPASMAVTAVFLVIMLLGMVGTHK